MPLAKALWSLYVQHPVHNPLRTTQPLLHILSWPICTAETDGQIYIPFHDCMILPSNDPPLLGEHEASRIQNLLHHKCKSLHHYTYTRTELGGDGMAEHVLVIPLLAGEYQQANIERYPSPPWIHQQRGLWDSRQGSVKLERHGWRL